MATRRLVAGAYLVVSVYEVNVWTNPNITFDGDQLLSGNDPGILTSQHKEYEEAASRLTVPEQA